MIALGESRHLLLRRDYCTLQTDSSGGIAEQYAYYAFGYPYCYDAAGNDTVYSQWKGKKEEGRKKGSVLESRHFRIAKGR